MIWRAEDGPRARVNGVNGFTNGHVDDGGMETLDPTSMQLG